MELIMHPIFLAAFSQLKTLQRDSLVGFCKHAIVLKSQYLATFDLVHCKAAYKYPQRHALRLHDLGL